MKLKQLHEQLQGVKKYHHLTWDDIRIELEKHGIHSIGMGTYGEVFHKSSWDYVIKVFENDNAYHEYVNFCIQNPNPHYPKFIKKPMNMHQFHTRLNKSNKMLQIVKMELLEPLDDLWYSDNLANIIDLANKEIKEIVLYNDDGELSEIYNNIDTLLTKVEKPQLKSLIAAGLKITNEFKSSLLDIHSENLMQRKDGTVVISDPLANTSRRGHLNPSSDYYFDDQGQGLEAGPRYKNTIKQLIMDFS